MVLSEMAQLQRGDSGGVDQVSDLGEHGKLIRSLTARDDVGR